MVGGRGGRFGAGRGISGGRGGFGGGRGPPRAQGWETVDRSKQACVFFAQGKCTKGEACPFSHSKPAEGSYNQAPVSAPPLQPSAAPGGRLQPVQAVPPLAHAPQAQVTAAAAVGTNGVKISSAGFSAKGRGLASASVMERKEPELPSSQGGPFSGGTSGTAAVVGSTGKTSYMIGRNGQEARVAASLDKRQETLGQTGIIALPDGGFVTRKRAAELQLGREERSAVEHRQVRQRDGREHGKAQERRPVRMGNGSATPGGRLSIMDRLGPAKHSPERASVRARVVAPTRARPEVPGQPVWKLEEPVERAVLQTSSPLPLPRPRVQSSVRLTRRTESGRGDGISASQVTRPTPATQQQKSSALDFKIPTLDEIKSRKAKAEGAAPAAPKKREGRPETTAKGSPGFAGSTERGPNTTTAVKRSEAAAVLDTQTSRSSAPAVAAEAQVPVVEPVLAPNPAPQLDAEDMDEFSEWL